ncbi:MAG: DUF2723 domain-containing protein, partial [Gemmatimonadaceae bacterium]
MATPLAKSSPDIRPPNRPSVALGISPTPGRTPPSRTTILSLLSAVSLLLGYGDLTRGGITVGPILLVLAYCVLIPAAIWQRRVAPGMRSVSDGSPRPSYVAAGIVTAGTLALYLATLAPSTAMWDTSEYMAAAYTLGLPHPPGNPLFVLIGRVFAVLPIA